MTLLLLLFLADDWEEILKGLATADFRNPDGPSYPYFEHVRKLGPAAYPHLIDFIDHEDLRLGQTAVSALVALTGVESALPTVTNKSMLKGSWQRTHGAKSRPTLNGMVLRMLRDRMTEAAFRSAFDDLSSDDPGVREDAEAKVLLGVLRHAAIFRRLLEAEQDAEARARAEPILTQLPRWEAQVEWLRSQAADPPSDPVWKILLEDALTSP